MNLETIWNIFKSDYTKLVLILAFAFYIAFIPNLGYAYPVHIDEWVHMSFANEITSTQSIDITDPFDGAKLKLREKMELGFQTFLAVTEEITGIDEVTLFRYFPSFIFMMTVLAVYVMARREGFGWQAAFMTCFITSTVGIMGPAFVIPVAMALLFVPILIFVAANYRHVWSYVTVFLLMCLLIAVHGPSAICAVLIMLPYIILSFRKEPRHSIWLGIAIFAPFLITLPITYKLAQDYIGTLFVQQPEIVDHDLPEMFRDYGYITIGITLVGTFFLAWHGGVRRYALVLGLLMISIMLVLFAIWNYGIAIVYLRGFLFCMLMMSIVGGYALKAVGSLQLPEKIKKCIKNPYLPGVIGPLLSFIIVVVALSGTLPSRVDTQYYRMIDKTDYNTFIWIKENLGQDSGIVLLDPWKATALTALTGKHVYTRLHNGSTPKSDAAYSFIQDGSSDSSFLQQNNISILYSRVFTNLQTGNVDYPPDNQNLIKIKNHLYKYQENPQ